jgi:hypothetical protein
MLSIDSILKCHCLTSLTHNYIMIIHLTVFSAGMRAVISSSTSVTGFSHQWPAVTRSGEILASLPGTDGSGRTAVAVAVAVAGSTTVTAPLS